MRLKLCLIFVLELIINTNTIIMQHEFETLERHLKQEYRKEYNKAYYKKIKQQKLEQEKNNTLTTIIQSVGSFKKITKEKIRRSTTIVKEVVTTTFHHEHSENKEVIYRDTVIAEIQKSTLRSGDIYGLSASEFKTETRIKNEVSKNFNFFSCENDDDVLYELYDNLAKEKFKMTVYNKDLGEVLSKLSENSIAHLIADYCSQLHSNYMDIADAVKRNIVMVDGIIAITVNKRISGKENVKWYDNIITLNNTETYKGVCKVENAFKIFLERICGFDYKIETYLDYCCEKADGGKGANMMLAIIRRVK